MVATVYTNYSIPIMVISMAALVARAAKALGLLQVRPWHVGAGAILKCVQWFIALLRARRQGCCARTTWGAWLHKNGPHDAYFLMCPTRFVLLRALPQVLCASNLGRLAARLDKEGRDALVGTASKPALVGGGGGGGMQMVRMKLHMGVQAALGTTLNTRGRAWGRGSCTRLRTCTQRTPRNALPPNHGPNISLV